MPEPVTVSVTVTPYGPEESDTNPGAYLQRCGESLLDAHGYSYGLMVTNGDNGVVRQLQITVPDEDAPGGRRAITAIAPQIVVDNNGSLEVMTEAMFDVKYGGGN